MQPASIPSPETALGGIKVLDLTHHIAGPYCTKLLADFGADVIKIERPGTGDPARRTAPFVHDEPHPDKSLLFLYLNTSKKSVTLDLKADTGREILRRLIRWADVLVENFRPRVMPSLGLGYEALRELNRRLVMVSISNFGQTGPNRNYEATDMVQYALGGLMYVIGSNGREPLKHALNQAQFKAGTNAAVAAVIAVFHQQLTGRGQMVDISIQESITAALRDTTSLYTYLGAIKRRHPDYVGDMPRSPVEVQDGFIVPVAYGGVDWDMMADFLDAPELTEERFSTPEGRLDNAREMGAVLGEALGRWKKEDLTRASRRRKGLLFGAVQSPADLYENPQYQARGYFAEIEHPVAGALTYPGAPFVMSRTPWRARTPAPTLGQHNQEVLCDELGHSVAELARLRAAGVT